MIESEVESEMESEMNVNAIRILVKIRCEDEMRKKKNK